jgi:hypothetical protein
MSSPSVVRVPTVHTPITAPVRARNAPVDTALELRRAVVIRRAREHTLRDIHARRAAERADQRRQHD